ncbi:MAG: VaFE repeat-containing surface-anchored protein [Bacillota bacterium]|nr:VaFE repeat-containing surface-anchored protein [Bacillota bacterium]
MMISKGYRSGFCRGIAFAVLALMMAWTIGAAGMCDAFAEETIEETIKVDCTYNKKFNYENYHTFNFKVKYEGNTLTAYCVQPKKRRMTKASHNALRYDNELVRKILYYSYGYPGFAEKTASYLETVDRKACYKGDQGSYVLCHLLLSYALSGKSPNSGAFKGLSSESAEMIKAVMAEMETWPDPPEAAGGLDQSEVTAEFNQESGEQETPYITFNADAEKAIDVPVPEGASLVKKSNDGTEEGITPESGETVTIAGGESFKFTAPADTDGSFDSPQIEGGEGGFSTYIINKKHRQSIVFGLNDKGSFSFSVKWSPSAAETDKPEPAIKTTAKADDSGEIVDEVSYTGLEAGTEYKIVGRLMDKSDGKEIEGKTAEKNFTPESADGTVTVEFGKAGDDLKGRELVAFEKLFKGDELIASHEDINDEAQTVTIKKDEPQEEQPPAGELTSDTPDDTDKTPDDTPAEEPSKEAPEESSSLPDTSVNAAGDSPATGDETHIAAVLMIAIGALLVICGCAAFRKSV